jgi:hypothetical protein
MQKLKYRPLNKSERRKYKRIRHTNEMEIVKVMKWASLISTTGQILRKSMSLSCTTFLAHIGGLVHGKASRQITSTCQQGHDVKAGKR